MDIDRIDIERHICMYRYTENENDLSIDRSIYLSIYLSIYYIYIYIYTYEDGADGAPVI
jgi:hypothetical protein